jgi:hypothetical protein
LPSTGGAVSSRQSSPEDVRTRRRRLERGLILSQNVTVLPSAVKSVIEVCS